MELLYDEHVTTDKDANSKLKNRRATNFYNVAGCKTRELMANDQSPLTS